MLLRGVGLGEDQRHLGEVAERDPHLLAADRPARVGLGRAGAQVGGVGAGVGLGQAEAAERLARAEPRQPALLLLLAFPSARSSRRPARSARRRRCGPRSRRARPARRSARSRCSRGRGRRSPRRPARPGSRPRPACCASSRSKRPARSLSRTRGMISRSANSRAASEISRCSSLSWKSISPCFLLSVVTEFKAPGPGSPRMPPAPRGCAGPAPRAARAPSIAATAWISRVVEARNASWAARRSATGQAPSSTCSALTRRSRVIDSSTPASSAGVRSPPCGRDPEDRRGRRLQHDPVGLHQHRLVGALRLGEPGRLHVGRVGERLDAVEDHGGGVGDGGEPQRLGVRGQRLGRGDPPAAAGDDQAQLAVDLAGPARAAPRSRPRARRGRTRARSPPRSAPAGRGGPRARRAGPRRGGSPRRRRRRGRARRRGAGRSPRRSARSPRRRWPARCSRGRHRRGEATADCRSSRPT